MCSVQSGLDLVLSTSREASANIGPHVLSFATPTHSRQLAAPAAARYSTADNTSCIHLQTQIRKFLPPQISNQAQLPPGTPRKPSSSHTILLPLGEFPPRVDNITCMQKHARGPMVLRSTFHPLNCLDTKLGVSVFVWVRIFSSRPGPGGSPFSFSSGKYRQQAKEPYITSLYTFGAAYFPTS